jgi:hypothetical protein
MIDNEALAYVLMLWWQAAAIMLIVAIGVAHLNGDK